MSEFFANEEVTPRLISGLGLFVMMFCAWLMSSNRRKINFRIVIGGVILQFILALLILRTQPGYLLFSAVGEFFNQLMTFVDEGSKFVFGPKFQDFKFAFQVLPTIIFVSALMSILYHFGVMQLIVRVMAWGMQKTLNTSGAETLAAAVNIFVGQTEAPLIIKPYVPTMTRSELMAVMVGGFASIAGGVMAVYISMGISAVHLLTASVISAPASLLIAKILEPEVETPKTRGTIQLKLEKETVNFLDAAAQGTADGVKLAINVAAMLIAFTALMAMTDYGLKHFGDIFDTPKYDVELTLRNIFSYVFWPFAWLMGVPPVDCGKVGELLGLRLVTNEFIAYSEFSTWIDPVTSPELRVDLLPRSQMIATYALCGFANFASIGIQVGGIGTMCPERKGDLARLGLRAMLGGMLACFMMACVAGIVL